MTAWTHGCPVYTNSGSSVQAVPEPLGSAGLGPEKIPKNETEYGQEDYEDRPQNFSSGIRTALKNIYDRPYIGDENNDTAQPLVLHVSIIPFGIAKILRYTLCTFRETEILHS